MPEWTFLLYMGVVKAPLCNSGSALRGLPELHKVCCDLLIFIRVAPLDIILKTFEILKGLGTTRIPQDGHLLLRLFLLTKLREDSHEERAGRPIIVVPPEGLSEVFLGLLIIGPGGLHVVLPGEVAPYVVGMAA